jgi:RNA-directed DNA polymerase
MKRVNNLYETICSIENLELADLKASKGKAKQPGVIAHRIQAAANLARLREMLLSKTYRTSAYVSFKVYEPKEREVYRLPYFPDRICHHAVMNVLEPIFTACFSADSYSCIKGKGIHAASNDLKKALRNVGGTTYCLKLDIKKYYPSVDHATLKQLLRRKIKDKDLLWLLDEVIDSAEGLPIGNYLSQYFANFYLTYFDHWIKEQKGVRYYYRYADDMVILADNKPYLHGLLSDIRNYLHTQLHLTIKHNYQVFPVDARSIDFAGYKHYHNRTLMRKGIKRGFAKAVKVGNKASIASYKGLAKHCDSRHLVKNSCNHV